MSMKSSVPLGDVSVQQTKPYSCNLDRGTQAGAENKQSEQTEREQFAPLYTAVNRLRLCKLASALKYSGSKSFKFKTSENHRLPCNVDWAKSDLWHCISSHEFIHSQSEQFLFSYSCTSL